MKPSFRILGALAIAATLPSVTFGAFNCAPQDDTGGKLTGQQTLARNTILCTYATAGSCEYFGANGTFSSGASTCPDGMIPDGSSTTTTRTPPTPSPPPPPPQAPTSPPPAPTSTSSPPQVPPAASPTILFTPVAQPPPMATVGPGGTSGASCHYSHLRAGTAGFAIALLFVAHWVI